MLGTNGITNMARLLSLTNQDAFWVWDSTALTNKTTTISNLFTGFPQNTNVTNGDFIVVYNAASNVLNTVPLSAVKAYVAHANLFETTNYFPFSSGSSNSIAHALGATPSNVRCTLLCVADDAATGFIAGDEIDLPGIIDSAGLSPVIATWANAVSIYIIHQSGGTGTRIMKRGSGDYSSNITTTNNYVWKVRAWQ